MTLPTTGNLKLSQVASEFGVALPAKLSDLYGAGGVVSGGTLKLSDFRGLSATPPETPATWVGLIEIQPAQDPANASQYGVDRSASAPYGSILTRQNYNNFTVLRTTGIGSVVVVGYLGFLTTWTSSLNVPTGYDARDVDRVEYRVYGGSVSGVLSGNLRGTAVAGGKYDSAWLYRVYEPNSGSLSNLATLADLFKYAADRNATVEIKTIIL